MGLPDESAHLLVDVGCHLVGVILLAGVVTPQEHLTRRASILHRPQPVAHPVLHHHAPGDLGRLLDVVGGAGGWVGEDPLLGSAAPEQHGELIDQLAPPHQVLVLGGERQRVPQRPAPGDDGDLVERVGVGQCPPHQGVTGLVVGDDQLLLVGDDPALALRTGDHPVDRLFNSGIPICCLLRLAASRADSLMRLARSAPVKPGV